MSRSPELAERLLFQEAVTVADHAYAPYSGYGVGAVAVGPSGRSHHGANVENAASPAGLCAERAALAALVTHGERELRYVAVGGRGRLGLPALRDVPAGALRVRRPGLVVRRGGEVVVLRLSDLLAAPFSLPREGPDA